MLKELPNARREWELAAGPILVTGATGFLGGHLARALLNRDIPVRVTGRNVPAGMRLAKLGADFRPVDLRDRESMLSVCEGVEAVVHSGALSSAWGAYRDFYDINVKGTRNVIDACAQNGVERLVHISSPSVMTRFEPQLKLKESDPLPDTFVSPYSETKKLAEDLVNEAIAAGQKAVILRPKAIYGPGDNAIFPRLILAASKGRLPIIGAGDTQTDLTHVDDVVSAILLALESEKAVGKTYVITGSEDVRIWDVISELVTRLGHDVPSKRLTLKKAMRVARILEMAWKVLPLPGEPPLTQYTVGILGITQTYDTTAAKTDLGYEPKMSLEEGMESVLASLNAEDSGPVESASVAQGNGKPLTKIELSIMRAGVTHTIERLFMPGGRWKRIDVPAMFALIQHPTEGYILFDTGYSRRYFEATHKFPQKLSSLVTPATVLEEDEAVQQLALRGITPEQVNWIILSHFDPDHYGGLRDFPLARIACSQQAWMSVAGKTGLAALRVRLLPGHLPEDMAARVHLLPEMEGSAIGPFSKSLDMFGDGSIRLVEVPGHAAGQLAAFVCRNDGQEVFLAADACWNLASIEDETFRGGVHRMIAVDKAGQDATYATMRSLRADHSNVIIVPTHCPRMWNEMSEKR